MKTKLLTLVVTLTIGIILAGSLLAPTISNASQDFEAKDVTQSNGLYYLNETKACTFEQDHTDYSVTLNGEVITLTGGEHLLITDKVIISAIVVASSVTTKATMGIWAEGLNSTTISALSTDITVKLENGTVTLTYGSPATTVTYDVTYAYLYSPDEGDYCVLNATYMTAAHLNTGDIVTLYNNRGWWGVTYAPVQVTANEGTTSVTTKTYAAGSTTATDVDISVNFTDVKYDELIMDSVDNTNVYALVPSSYTAYEANEYSALLSAIPILVIVSLVLVAVGAIALKNRD